MKKITEMPAMIKLPCIDLLHFDPVIRSYIITFCPKTKIEQKEVVSISFDSPEGIQIEDKLKTISKLLGKNVITFIVHGGGNKYGFKFKDEEDLLDYPLASREIFKEFNCLGQIAEKSFLLFERSRRARSAKNEKKCQCELCKRHKRLKKIMAKLPKKYAEDLRDIIEGLECQEMDLEVWEAKANGSWPDWEEFGVIYKDFLKKKFGKSS